MREHGSVVPGARFGNQHRRVLVPGRVRAGVVTGAGAAPQVAQQVAVALEQVDECVHQRDHAIRGQGARPRRRIAAQDPLLEGALLVVDERHDQAGAVAEAVEDRALADPGGTGDLVRRDVGDAALLEQLASGGQHLLAVAGGVGASGRRSAQHGELGGGALARCVPAGAGSRAPRAPACVAWPPRQCNWTAVKFCWPRFGKWTTVKLGRHGCPRHSLLLVVGGLLALQAAANINDTATGNVRRRHHPARHRRHPAAGGHGRRAGVVGAFGLLDEAPGWHLVGPVWPARSTSPPASCCSRGSGRC